MGVGSFTLYKCGCDHGDQHTYNVDNYQPQTHLDVDLFGYAKFGQVLWKFPVDQFDQVINTDDQINRNHDSNNPDQHFKDRHSNLLDLN